MYWYCIATKIRVLKQGTYIQKTALTPICTSWSFHKRHVTRVIMQQTRKGDSNSGNMRPNTLRTTFWTSSTNFYDLFFGRSDGLARGLVWSVPSLSNPICMPVLSSTEIESENSRQPKPNFLSCRLYYPVFIK